MSTFSVQNRDWELLNTSLCREFRRTFVHVFPTFQNHNMIRNIIRNIIRNNIRNIIHNITRNISVNITRNTHVYSCIYVHMPACQQPAGPQPAGLQPAATQVAAEAGPPGTLGSLDPGPLGPLLVPTAALLLCIRTVHGTWSIVHMVHGTWYMVHGAWYMVHGTYYIVHKTWYRTWYLVHNP